LAHLSSYPASRVRLFFAWSNRLLGCGKRGENFLTDGAGRRPSQIDSAKGCLATACRNLGYPHFTHHDLRHFFATTCIESGVDIPTVSRWLGHKDGGALAMRVYGHLRQEHSLSMIKRVQF
jgi:integrase